jgi:3-chloro-4-hydroxyphenylacetate reductive dehalogenase
MMMEKQTNSTAAGLERYLRRKILYGNEELSRYPLHKLRRVDRPTNLISENVQRVDPHESADGMARCGLLGDKIQSRTWRLSQADPVTCAMAGVLSQAASIKVKEAADKAPVPQDPHVMSRHIKSLAYFFGADIVGIGPVPDYAYFKVDLQGKPVTLDYKYAIVILNKKNLATMSASFNSDWIGDSISFQAYLQICMVAEALADYIRRLGYSAVTQYDGGDLSGKPKFDLNFMPLILWAGLGEVSRAFMVLNPFLGLGYKVGAVLTNLPMELDKPIDFGLQDFCGHCHICADACPCKAIPYGDKVMYNGYEQWRLNTRLCASNTSLNQYGVVCNACTKACPWTRPYNQRNNLVRRAVITSGLARRVATRYDSMRGRHKAPGDEARQWWFDLEYEKQDGTLRLPPEMPENRKSRR